MSPGISRLEHQNEFIGSLRSADVQALKPHLQPVTLARGEVLHHPDIAIPYVYFPTEGLVSLRVRFKNGGVIETASIGTDGIVGASVAGGTLRALDEAFVVVPGEAWRMRSSALIAACERSPSLQSAVLRYTMQLLAQAQQVAACASSHVLEQRLASWILRLRDQQGSDSLATSQEYRSQALGVQRTSVTLAEKNLQEAQLIRVRRGRIEIADPEGLERVACECYDSLKHKCSALRLDVPAPSIVLSPLEDGGATDAMTQRLAERITGVAPREAGRA